MPVAITTTDLSSYLRDPQADPDAATVVELANGVVNDVIGDLDPLPTRVTAITLEVAARAWRNPHGYSSETVDDYTYRRDAETRRAGVYLTDDERAELGLMVTPTRGSFFSMPLTSPLDVEA